LRTGPDKYNMPKGLDNPDSPASRAE
jgi:hypothetical protein